MRLAHQPFVFILSSPSGTGKTTLARAMVSADSDIRLSVSLTTRPKREGEREANDYFFVEKSCFLKEITRGALLEYAHVFGHWYGTPGVFVEKTCASGKDVLLDIDWQGAEKIYTAMQWRAIRVFLLPPDSDSLYRRLSKRARDPKEVIEQRMAAAANEMARYEHYDYVLINHDLQTCLQQLLSILQAERCKRERRIGLQRFVENLQKASL